MQRWYSKLLAKLFRNWKFQCILTAMYHVLHYMFKLSSIYEAAILYCKFIMVHTFNIPINCVFLQLGMYGNSLTGNFNCCYVSLILTSRWWQFELLYTTIAFMCTVLSTTIWFIRLLSITGYWYKVLSWGATK